jgi:hypothetical protein
MSFRENSGARKKFIASKEKHLLSRLLTGGAFFFETVLFGSVQNFHAVT